MSQHSILHMGDLLMVQERERFLSRLLRRQNVDSLDDFRAFEAGLSPGHNLRLLVQWGGNPANMAGVAIDPGAAAACAELSPGIRIHSDSAGRIPEPGQIFDLSMAFTLFSTVHDEDMAHEIARELFRITKPGGLIVVYDMRRKNPRNPEVHPVAEDDIRRWFPKCPLRIRSITLAPPLARLVGRNAPWFYGPLAAIPPLRTHAMYVLRRPATPPVWPANTGAER